MRIAITGPESSGKTSLAKELSEILRCPRTEEYAREYLHNNPSYTYNDLGIIWEGQRANERKLSLKQPTVLICDTDSLVMGVWSIVKFGKISKEIQSALNNYDYHLSILCLPDFPWEYDVLRENPNDRDYLLNVYIKLAEQYKINLLPVSGPIQNRIDQSIAAISNLKTPKTWLKKY